MTILLTPSAITLINGRGAFLIIALFHEEYYADGTIPWVKTGEIKDNIIIHTDECITEDGVKGSSAKLLPQGAVVMAMYGVNIGMLAYLDSEMTCNQACCVFSDKNEIISRHYLFHYLYSIRDY